ncbi:Mitochondrial acidic protein mam33 [Serendipita sp. 399]|nr:Mitochondrial acidic protein mam33 [Serendipita sp. 399]
MSSFRVLRVARNVSRLAQPISISARVSRTAALPSISQKQTPQLVTRAFSVSSRVFASTEADKQLLTTLDSEIKHEVESMNEVPEQPEFLQEFKKAGIWTIEDAPGQDEVFITRKFEGENIRVMFTISDVENSEPVFDEEGSEEEDEEALSGLFPIRASIQVTKPTGGALNIEALVQDGIFSIETVSYYKDAKLASEMSAESDYKRRGKYIGPQFEHLDVSVQEAFEAYLSERNIDESLALFIPEYAEWKEQKEYLSWLNGVKSFITA